MGKKILGLDLGSNSLGWALLEADDKGKPRALVDLGVRIFIKAVEDQAPTPKNAKRRQSRLMRRVIQRRARRKKKMLNYLVKLGLLPETLKDSPQPEVILNQLGDPYELRTRALHEPLQAHELGRALLHLVQRRGFLSNKKTLLGSEMLDDPDVQAVLEEMREDEPDPDQKAVDKDDKQAKEAAAEETAFKKDISALREEISDKGFETLGEFLHSLPPGKCKRNRTHAGGHLRTDRKMYQEELEKIWAQQEQHHAVLDESARKNIEHIIFHQRPLKLKPDRVGKCSLEKNHFRCRMGRLEYQKFRYMQDINHLSWRDPASEVYRKPNAEERQQLWELFETDPAPSFTKMRKKLKLDKSTEFQEISGVKKFKGNRTACAIRKVLPQWDDFPEEKQYALVEDLITIGKKTALKKRLMNHWQFDATTAVRLCMLEFEDDHGNHSSKAIKKLLPHLREGLVYSDARQEAGYKYETKEDKAQQQKRDRLGPPPEIPNPIVQKGLHELRRVVNAIIAEHGKPDIIRIEMARDLQMNTKRYEAFSEQQKKNTAANDEAAEEYETVRSRNPNLQDLSTKLGRVEKFKFRLWKDQNHLCAYSARPISQTAVFTSETEIDHILPYSRFRNDSYMNKVLCYVEENRIKGNRTPKDAFAGDPKKWEQITQALARWDKKLHSKRDRFYKTEADLQEKEERDFSGSQLTDTRYISREAGQYLQPLGAQIDFSRGVMTAWLRRLWGLNSILPRRDDTEADKKERSDHRHHTIDAVVTACIDRGFYQRLFKNAERLEQKHKRNIVDLRIASEDIGPPWDALQDEVRTGIDEMIVSHAPQTKIRGALHEETGAGFIEGVGTVYRKNLDQSFKPKQVERIIDPAVKEQVRKHLAQHGDKSKEAFAEGVIVYHKDGKTPIHRVRMTQQTQIKELEKLKLEETNFAICDQQGKAFRWMVYGNLHHIEIIRHKQKDRYKGKPVTTLEVARRARGINRAKAPLIQKNHGENYEFIMALHINDMVRVQRNGKPVLYRVQKIESTAVLTLRLHTAATLNYAEESLRKSVSTLINKYQMQKIRVNAIGKLLDDQAHG